MTLVAGSGTSTLNPNAPLFVPAVYRQVEDFSPEWWQLVTTTAWYEDYWISQHQDDFYNNTENDVSDGNDIADWLEDTFDPVTNEDLQFEEFEGYF
ncbi:protein EARLY RESPONSIVE TO DEHYDRATION 15-like [Hibiscus syriacus]|uniref:protein EARLY RESPONSIVE TO DEHYDRATION 15-like n=1 Tax=Hibiscus syriacus TaxID=106335 RepID=UPI0019249F06|nr:protein EARLY RESPONSIVE TO DEHYDRATION 15-like [Hibiscus syriacus]